VSARIWGNASSGIARGLTPGFSSRYGCNRLVFYERYERTDEAIAREKQIKGGSRARKIALIEAMNPDGRISIRASRRVGDGLLRLRLAMTSRALQRSAKLTASPLSDVSLYVDCMSGPVGWMLVTTLCGEKRCRPSV
jgi:hypothetical protein